MTQAAKNIIGILNRENIEGTSFDREFAEFVGHFSNIKGFLSKHDQDLSEPKLALIRMYRRFGAHERVKDELYEVLAFPIDYSHRPWKKFSAAIKALGYEAGIDLEK